MMQHDIAMAPPQTMLGLRLSPFPEDVCEVHVALPPDSREALPTAVGCAEGPGLYPRCSKAERTSGGARWISLRV